ncbi:uncharacterized protein LOC113311109 [Papaver somniferum]|uniref:uncharacterized protein LOC113311109 n=1 Tax=Papaver somniferum TaxID=3469 RepID=UPI000E702B22|nr:uncharacterized protein LOC113311109 [Papaver somniferum]
MAEVQTLSAIDGYTQQMDNSSFFRNSRFSEDTTNSGFGAAFTFCTGDFVLWVLLILSTIGSYRNKGLIRIFGGFRDKSIDLIHGFWLWFGVFGLFCSKISSCLVGISKLSKNPRIEKSEKTIDKTAEICEEINEKSPEISEQGKNDEDGDEEMSTIEELKKAIEIEREEKNRAVTELENERMSSTCATNEAMDMILRLQGEKSSILIEANQCKRLAEQKQQYDQEIIQSLQWVIFKHESERSVLENQLKLCKLKLRECLKLDELEQFEEELLNCANVEEDGASTGSRDTDSSSMMEMQGSHRSKARTKLQW